MVATPTNGGATPSITQLLHDGQSVLVQVVKDPLGSKGARLTTLLSIPSRYLVLLSHEPHVGVSARLEDETERGRLKQVLDELQQRLAPDFGVIARTAADRSEEHTSELQSLMRISYAVFCLKKKKTTTNEYYRQNHNELGC